MKVFSREKFYADESLLESLKVVSRDSGWPEKCDGKTKEECNALGCWIPPDWMEEKDMGYKERQAEWSKMNNLAIGSRVYVYRKAKNEEGGWPHNWIGVMDSTVGKVARITKIAPCSLVVNVGKHSFYMPYTALLPVGVTEFEVGRRYKYVGTGGAKCFSSLSIPTRDAELIASGTELIAEAVNGDEVKFTTTICDWNFVPNWADFVALPEKDHCAEPDIEIGDKARTIKVFRKRKMMETLKNPVTVAMVDSMEWPIGCDGISADVLRGIGFFIKDEWCEEMEV